MIRFSWFVLLLVSPALSEPFVCGFEGFRSDDGTLIDARSIRPQTANQEALSSGDISVLIVFGKFADRFSEDGGPHPGPLNLRTGRIPVRSGPSRTVSG